MKMNAMEEEPTKRDRYCTYRNSTWIICLNALCITLILAAVALVKGALCIMMLLVLQAFSFYALLRAVVMIEKLSRIIEEKFTDDGESVILKQKEEQAGGQPKKLDEQP